MTSIRNADSSAGWSGSHRDWFFGAPRIIGNEHGVERVSALLGDVVICAPVVASEAVVQDKLLEAHWAHIVVHGVLHLLGFDHHKEGDANRMETTETGLLAGLGYANPYDG